MTTADTDTWQMTFDRLQENVDKMIQEGRSDEAMNLAEAFLVGFAVQNILGNGFTTSERARVAGWHSNLMLHIYGSKQLPQTVCMRAQAHIAGRRGPSF